MQSSTLFFLLTVFLVALTISVSAFPGEEKKEEKEEGEKKEGGEGGEEGEKKEGEGKEKGESNSARSLFSCSGLSAVMSLAIASVILSIH